MSSSKGCEQRLCMAEEHCRLYGLTLTPLRHRVLEIVLAANRPIGAYDILAKLTQERGKTAPPTIYRALEFLTNQRLIHKVHSLNAYFACIFDDSECGRNRQHTAELLICRACGTTREIIDDHLRQHIHAKAGEAGFLADGIVLEVQGLCHACQ